MKSIVSIAKTIQDPGREEIFEAVNQAVEMAGGLPKVISADKTVLIKPNLVAVSNDRRSGATTHPEVCRALAELVKARGAKPIIAESAAVGQKTRVVIEKMGYSELEKEGYQVIDLKETPRVKVHNPEGRIIPDFETFTLVQEADAIISVPVMKTHDSTEVTLSIKNLKGLISDKSKMEMHRLGLFEGVPEIAKYFKPVFAVIDGIYTQEGIGPVFGSPVEMDLVMASSDLVALDCITSMVMGYKPEEVLLTSFAAKLGIGTMELSQIEVLGETVDKVYRRFKRAAEDDILKEAPPFQLIFQDACTGCRNSVVSSLIDLKEYGRLDYLKDKIIIAGPVKEIPSGVSPNNLIVVGKCAQKFRDKGFFASGCPPYDVPFVKFFEDAARQDRRLAARREND